MIAPVRILWYSLCLLLFSPFHSFAQRAAVDSLYNNLSQYGPKDTMRVRAFIQLAYAYNQIDPDSTQFFARKAQELSEQLQYIRGIALSQQVLGVAYSIQGNYADAQQSYLRALDLFEMVSDSTRIAQNLSNLAGILYYQQNYLEAEKYLQQALAILERRGILSAQADTRFALAMVYQAEGDLPFAEQELRKMVQIYAQTGNRVRQAATLTELATNLRSQGKTQDALLFLRESLQISRDLGTRRDLAHTLSTMGDLSLEMHRYTLARTNLSEALQLAVELNIPEIQIDVYSSLAKLDSTEGNLLKAYQHLQRSQYLTDMVRNDNQREELEAMRGAYEVKQKEKELAKLKAQQHSQADLLISQERQLGNQKLALAILAALLIGMGAYLFYRQRQSSRQKRDNEALVLEKQVVETQQTELAALNETKDQWFSMICHDFKLPFTFMQGALALLNEGRVSEAERKMLLLEMENRVRNNSILLDNLLYWAQDQQQGIVVRKEQINIHQVIRDQLILLTPEAERHGVYITNQVAESANVLADPYMIQLTIKNMLNNAIGMTKKGERITITADSQGQHIVIHIADGGARIPTKYLDKLFSFDHRRLIEGYARERGLGMSLLISRDFIEKNDGKMWVSSQQAGNIFSFSLPTVNSNGHSHHTPTSHSHKTEV